MNWEALGVAAEIVGAAGVIITLAYVAMQIRQNTNQLKGEAVSSINDTETGLTKELRGDHDLFVLLVRGTSVWGALEPQEQARVHLFLHSYTRWLETCWTLSQGGALTKGIFESRETFLTGLLGQPNGGRIWWDMWKTNFDPSFAAHLDERFIELGENIPYILDVPFYNPKNWQSETAV